MGDSMSNCLLYEDISEASTPSELQALVTVVKDNNWMQKDYNQMERKPKWGYLKKENPELVLK